jgi:hypothetical protein
VRYVAISFGVGRCVNPANPGRHAGRHELQYPQAVPSVRDVREEAVVRHADLDVVHVVHRAVGVEPVVLAAFGMLGALDVHDGDPARSGGHVGVGPCEVEVPRVRDRDRGVLDQPWRLGMGDVDHLQAMASVTNA